MTFTTLIDGVNFGEGPRWHDGRLWYSDFYQHAVYAVDATGNRETMVEFPDDRPSGLGWLPDGDLLIVSMTRRQLWRVGADGSPRLHCDLSAIAEWYCNDMVVDAAGNAYVGNFGFDLESQADFAAATLALVRPDGSAEVAATGLAFPNGAVITPDGSTLIVGETFGGSYKAFDIADDATLEEMRTWADIPGTAPDGCCLDAEGAIWFADAIGSKLVRVREGGEVTDELTTPQPVYACMLGGDDGATLFALTAPDSHPDVAGASASGSIMTTMVEVPHAGLP